MKETIKTIFGILILTFCILSLMVSIGCFANGHGCKSEGGYHCMKESKFLHYTGLYSVYEFGKFCGQDYEENK